MSDLERLKLLTQETDSMEGGDTPSMRYFTDDELINWLELHQGDVKKTAYYLLLSKAENSKVHFAGGTELPDQSAYFLRLAANLRPNQGGARKREDEP